MRPALVLLLLPAAIAGGAHMAVAQGAGHPRGRSEAPVSLDWTNSVTLGNEWRQAVVPPEAAPLIDRARALLTELRDWSRLPPIPANGAERARHKEEIVRLHDEAVALGWQPAVEIPRPPDSGPAPVPRATVHLRVTNGPATVLAPDRLGVEHVAPLDASGAYAFDAYGRQTSRTFVVVLRDGFEPFIGAFAPVWPESITMRRPPPEGAPATQLAHELRPWNPVRDGWWRRLRTFAGLVTTGAPAQEVPVENAWVHPYLGTVSGTAHLTVTLTPIRRQ